MRRVAMFALALAVAAPACDDDNPTAQPIVFTATMNTANEVPAIPTNSPEIAGTGTATISFTGPRDGSGNFTGDVTANFQFNLASFPTSAVIRAAHIHLGASGVPGGILVDTGLTPATAVTLTSGGTQLNLLGPNPVSSTLANTIAGNPAGYYFNVHSNQHTGGVVRGQLVRVN
jgi:hypothetical protein